MSNFEKFVISQAGLIIKNGKCLILKDAKYPWWLLPGGRVDVGEIGSVAFKREIKEELGLDDFNILGVVDYDIWYTADENAPVCAVVNLLESEVEDIVLSPEHAEYKWILEGEIGDYEFRWPKTKEMIKSGFKYKKLLEKNGE